MPRFTDKQFFDWEIEHGIYLGGHNKGFFDVHNKLAVFIINTIRNSYAFDKIVHLDLGGGNSPLTRILQENFVESSLIEMNKYSVELQRSYNTQNVYELDFCANGLTGVYDIITSIEVFEHIEDKKLLPFIYKLPEHCKYFIFSSTPHHDTPEFDEQWGHVNIKQTDEWIKVFELAGFELMKEQTEYLQKNCIPTTWTLMFKSKVNA